MPVKITSLTNLQNVEATDYLQIIDRSDTSMGPHGSNKKIEARVFANEMLRISTVIPAVVQTSLIGKANLASPTFTGSVVLPAATTIGLISPNELAALNNINTTQTIQAQLDLKMPASASTFTDNATINGSFTVSHPAGSANINVNGAATINSSLNITAGVAPTAVNVRLTAVGNNIGGNLGTFSNHPLTFSTGSTEKMRITAAGFVGINQADPTTQLDVGGNIKASVFIGNLTGNVNGNLSGIAASATTAAACTGNAVTATTAATATTAVACIGNSATATRAQTTSFRTATGTTESTIGVTLTGQPDAYLYSNSTNWGLASEAGGTLCDYTRANGRNTFYGAAQSIMEGSGRWPMTFNWAAQPAGNPDFVWGSNNGTDHYVWDPEHFRVAFATDATNAVNATTAAACTGNSATATRASNGPGDGATFTCDQSGDVSKIAVRGFGFNAGAGIAFTKATTEAATALRFANETGAVNGSIVINADGGINVNGTSDYRLKKNLVPVSNGLLKVNELKPTNFSWVSGNPSMDGFIAHEVATVVSNAVTGEKDAVDENGKPIYQQIDQTKLIPIMVAAIQELSARLAALENK